jgi:hypothetical protein
LLGDGEQLASRVELQLPEGDQRRVDHRIKRPEVSGPLREEEVEAPNGALPIEDEDG